MHKKIRFIDLFCGIGGFRYALESIAWQRKINAQCVFSSDINSECRKSYQANFNETPYSDITKINEKDIPDHDILLAGFPCQPFSILGQRKGFEDTRGTLFFDIARILHEKRPAAFVLENVKTLERHNGGKTLGRILQTLSDMNYYTDYRVLNALDFGLPQKRERIWIAGINGNGPIHWPKGGVPMTPLSEILEKDVPEKFYASEHIKRKRYSVKKPTNEPTIWHENKAGHISVYPFSCALRAGASYNYLLVNGERRLTPREMLRLQGFPERFQLVCNDAQTRKQAGNSLPVKVAEAVIDCVFDAMGWGAGAIYGRREDQIQMRLFEGKKKYEAAKTKKC